MRKQLGILVLAALACSLPLSASTFVLMTPVEMVRQAESIVQGRVIEVESFWSEGGELIISEATVEVDEVLLGEATATVTVRTFGGEVGGIVVEAHGFPVFERGEHVILFLNREASDDSTRVLGYQQGHFEVVERLDGVTLAVPQIDEGMRLVERSGKLAPEARSLRLDQFKSNVRDLARQVGRLPVTELSTNPAR